MKHTISVLVENEFGVLTRVAGLFSGRGFNIQSLTVAETLDPALSRMTLVTTGDDAMLEQITKQLNKLVNIIKVTDLVAEKAICRMYALLKVNISVKTRTDVLKTVEMIGGEILDVDAKSATVEVRGDEPKIQSALNLLKPFGIIEFVQSGAIAMERSK
ncbi:acetolactate synthase small subunit [bacterium]|nr:acetolactate synthase small subunit [bacterium]